MGSSKSFYNDCNKYRKIKLIKKHFDDQITI